MGRPGLCVQTDGLRARSSSLTPSPPWLQPLADHSTRLDCDKGPRHRPGSSPQENSTTRSASTPAPASSCSRKSDTCRPEGQHRHLPEGWAGRGQVCENRRERSRESLGTDSLKEDKTNDTRCWQPHSNHLREQQGKSSNLAQWVSALAVQQNHHFEKIYIHGQAQPKLLSKNL